MQTLATLVEPNAGKCMLSVLASLERVFGRKRSQHADGGGSGAGRVRGVLGGEGDLARGDSDRDGGDRDRVSS